MGASDSTVAEDTRGAAARADFLTDDVDRVPVADDEVLVVDFLQDVEERAGQPQVNLCAVGVSVKVRLLFGARTSACRPGAQHSSHRHVRRQVEHARRREVRLSRGRTHDERRRDDEARADSIAVASHRARCYWR